jgi:hypothetical protein
MCCVILRFFGREDDVILICTCIDVLVQAGTVFLRPIHASLSIAGIYRSN